MLYELLTTHALLPEGLPLSALTYTEDEHGKPWLDKKVQAGAGAVHFSISHTKNAIAVAIADRPVGIDVEAVVSPARIADVHFIERTMSTDEQQTIRAAADPCRLFTELWTKKEALVKAIGTGLNMDTLPDLLQSVPDATIQSACADDYAYAIACM